MTSFLITGGTGSMGQQLVRQLLENTATERVCVFSRDEWKQDAMRNAGFTDPRLRFFIGDVRDRDRLRRAMHGVDNVIHTAALKQVPACEYNPLEAVKTNVDGTANVIDAALDADVAKVLMLSSDKACDPVNLYGATKLVAEKLIVDANAYAGTRFACTRYGNVISSRGSVLPLFQAQHAAGSSLTVTDRYMTRFVLTLEQGARFVLESLERMQGGEIFVPKIPAVSVSTIAEAVTWPENARVILMGARPGEKPHETLVSEHEASRTTDEDDCYVIRPVPAVPGVPDGFSFRSAGGSPSRGAPERLDVDGFRLLAGMAA
jgi:UDP-N-acetylglucosamine 4,6-dehydratase